MPDRAHFFTSVGPLFTALCVAIVLVLGVVYTGVYLHDRNLLLGTVKEQAVSYFDLIVTARRWNAGYGSVYVEKRAGVEANPYLQAVGQHPDILCTDGRVLTMRNPAAMTAEISRLTEQASGVRFHITSLSYLNPANAPDRFERRALEAFNRGERERWEVDGAGAEPVFRYMEPVLVEETCLVCHAGMGYQRGQVRGGISVAIPFASHQNRLRARGIVVASLFLLTVVILLGTAYVLTGTMVRRLEEARERLRELSLTDELTALGNRRFIMQRLAEEFQRSRRTGEPLSVIIADLDHFKEVNDTHGHTLGDAVLREVARRMKGRLRAYDLLGRFGGEEFLVVAPGTELAEAVSLAERIRGVVGEAKICHDQVCVPMSLSAGVAERGEEDGDPDGLLRRADAALYRAKEGGRNRVET